MSLLLLTFTVAFSALIYHEKRKDLLNKIDDKLYTSALFARSIMGEDYHDKITGKDTFSKEEYLKIIDRYNTICEQHNLQYLWSLMLYDYQIVFTSSTTKDHDIKSGQHALFFDIHTNPDAYTKVFETMQPQYQLTNDKWGLIRTVLIPFKDTHGRKYLFGASVTFTSVRQLIIDALLRASGLSLVVLLVGIVASIIVARAFSQPIIILKDAAKDIAAGHYAARVNLQGSPEIKSLSSSINEMSASIEETIGALRTSEERLELALEATSDALWDWDPSTDEAYFSPRYFTMLGYKPNELPASYELWKQLVHPDDQKEAAKRVENILMKGKPYRSEYRMKMKQGGWAWILSRGRMVPNPDKASTRMIGTHTDISLEKQAELALREAKKVAEDANHAKSQFLTSMSHELQAPLAGMLKTLKRLVKTTLDEDQQKDITQAVVTCEQLTKALSNILDLSKIEAGKIDGLEKDFSLRESLKPIRNLFASSAAHKGIDFSVHIDDALPDHLHGHRARFNQILTNIVGNAIKFTDSGSVLVHLHALTPLTAGTARVLISVSDTGIGIPDFMIPRIFTAYRPIENAPTHRIIGAGLGLSIAKQLVGMMGGSICVESKELTGTTFYIHLVFRTS